MLEGRDDTLGTAVEFLQEIMNKIVSEAGSSERFFYFLLSYSNCVLGISMKQMLKKLLNSTYVTETPLHLHYEVWLNACTETKSLFLGKSQFSGM